MHPPQPGAPSALRVPDTLESPQASAHGSWWPEQAARSGCGAGGAVSTSGDSEEAAPGKAGSSSAEGTSLGECTSTGPVSDGSGGSGNDEALVQVRGALRSALPAGESRSRKGAAGKGVRLLQSELER